MDADSQCRRRLDDEQVDLAVEVFRMLADPTRVRLLWSLIGRELPVNELAVLIGKPGPSVSQHLAKLRMARLVQTRREGTSVFYRVANDHIEQLVTDAIFNAEHASSEIPAHHRQEPHAESGVSAPRKAFPGAETPLSAEGLALEGRFS